MIIVVGVAAVIVGLVFWRRAADRKAAIAGPQGEAVRAVETFMNTAAKLSSTIYEERKLEKLKKEAEALETAPSGEAEKKASDITEKYGLKPPYYLFADEELGKATFGALLFFQFDAFVIQSSKVETAKATVTVSVQPKDVLGIGAAIEKLGAPKQKMRKKPVGMFFHLEKRGYRWYITDVTGEIEMVLKLTKRMRRYR